ncbi:MAG: glycoside hydrolase family 127 protein [Defluviitaleaceae bacterium]|nr:glycoside hydrolase family 127 protein [Defluviitaleaceae bacterium]
MELFFEKYANFARLNEPVNVSLPFAKGKIFADDLAKFRVYDNETAAMHQIKPLGFWEDNSVKWLKLDFLADLPANQAKKYFCDFDNPAEQLAVDNVSEISIEETAETITIDNGCIKVILNNSVHNPDCKMPFNSFIYGDFCVSEKQIDGFYILDEDGTKYTARITEPWQIVENGAVFAKLSVKGCHIEEGIWRTSAPFVDFIINIFVYAKTPWIKVEYRIINRVTWNYFLSNFLCFDKISLDFNFSDETAKESENSENTDYFLATSNYRSDIRTKADGERLEYTITAEHLLNEANEQIPESFYGTFFADFSGENGGICATLYQAYQNFPKAFAVDNKSLKMDILPSGVIEGGIKYHCGMAKNHTFFLHLHGKLGENITIEDINKRSLMLQHSDKPLLSSEVYKQAEIYNCIFTDDLADSENSKNSVGKISQKIAFESFLTNIADNRGKAYGFLHWGDSPDAGYSQQGRAQGDNVWTNNEYDFPFAVMQLFAMTGQRRLLDYLLVTAAHWADIDVCHFDTDPLKHGAQIEHCKDHVVGNVEISHEWVEGLFAYYYQTGDSFAYDTAIGIGDNIMRHLEQPKYHKDGEINARETGWALRAFSALYTETNDPKWLKHADFIVEHFEKWRNTYGGWLAPYTDHTAVRVPFMISVAIGSLMRYYRISPSEEIKQKIKNMIIAAADDLLENARLPNGLFYYKELPSLRRSGGNTLVLEALASAYELTRNEKYLQAGIPSFRLNLRRQTGNSGKKQKIRDGVLIVGPSVKAFAQCFYPLTYYFYWLSQTKLLAEILEI